MKICDLITQFAVFCQQLKFLPKIFCSKISSNPSNRFRPHFVEVCLTGKRKPTKNARCRPYDRLKKIKEEGLDLSLQGHLHNEMESDHDKDRKTTTTTTCTTISTTITTNVHFLNSLFSISLVRFHMKLPIKSQICQQDHSLRINVMRPPEEEKQKYIIAYRNCGQLIEKALSRILGSWH